ncbi:ubiquitin-conjugating enzyme/RWD-like protein [Mycena galericulata]|nr:ubiquitin-conjugating enzyme/RWD-like protein [Mycena galericulata]
MSLSPPVMRRLMREITQLKNSPPEGIRVQTSEDNVLDLTGIIAGPEGTPYAGGYFKVKFHFTEEFPAAPPKCRLLTKIFHPNVSSAGEICVNTLKKDWNASFGIAHILVTVKCLLIYPNPESALDEEAGKLLLEDYSAYCSRARLITSVHATPRVRPAEFDVPAVGGDAEASTSSSSTPNAKTTPTPPPTSAPTFLPPPPTRKSASPAPPAIASSSLLPLPLPSLKSTSPPVSLSENAGSPLVGVPFPMPMPMALPFPVSKHTSSTPGTGPGTGTPLPLGTADANVALPVPAKDPKDAGNAASNGGKDGKEGNGGAGNGNTTKAVKRTLGGSTGPGAGTSGSGAEKRKKALKRL